MSGRKVNKQMVKQTSTFRPFLYKKSASHTNKETPYSVFLRYTNEKGKSAKVLVRLLAPLLRQKRETKVLDIGSGDGTQLRRIFERINLKEKELKLYLVEPSKSFIPQLNVSIANIPHVSLIRMIQKKYEKLGGYNSYFDIILASHLYHIARKDRFTQFSRMIRQLKTGGHLLFVLREKDDQYHFKSIFQKKFFGGNYLPGTLEECLETFREISERMPLKIKTYTVTSHLQFPVDKGNHDSIHLIEFLINVEWRKLPISVREEVVDYIKSKRGHFVQKEGIAVIEKLVSRNRD